MDEKINKKGQVAIWIIIAVLLVGSILLFFYIERNASLVVPDEKNPKAFIKSCMEEKIIEREKLILKQGGYVNPNSNKYHTRYNNVDLAYLCYAEKEKTNCINLEPVLIGSFEKELEKDLIDDLNACFISLEKNYKQRGYDFISKPASFSLDVVPDEIKVFIEKNISVTKESKESYDKFDFTIDSSAFKLLALGNSIINYEAGADCNLGNGNADIVKLQMKNTDLELARFISSNNDKIYTISDERTTEELRFAIRNCWRAP
jgi:hypothetical protein